MNGLVLAFDYPLTNSYFAWHFYSPSIQGKVVPLTGAWPQLVSTVHHFGKSYFFYWQNRSNRYIWKWRIAWYWISLLLKGPHPKMQRPWYRLLALSTQYMTLISPLITHYCASSRAGQYHLAFSMAIEEVNYSIWPPGQASGFQRSFTGGSGA